MDKQKQIEEMADIIDDCTWVTDEDYCENTSCPKCNATRLYKAGYRKIPEGAAVLTNENEIKQYEWSKMLDKMGVFKFADNLRKETAEKFAEMVEKKTIPVRINIAETAKDDRIVLWGDIKKICKEITEGK